MLDSSAHPRPPSTDHISPGAKFSSADALGLTRTQRRILEVLWGDLDIVHTIEDICRAVWGFTPITPNDFRLVHVNVNRMRARLRASKAPGSVRTHYGRGYSWQVARAS